MVEASTHAKSMPSHTRLINLVAEHQDGHICDLVVGQEALERKTGRVKREPES